MAISIGNKIKLTSVADKLFVEVGGGDPDKTLTEQELRAALKNAITVLAENRSPYLLKLYKQLVQNGRVQPLESLMPLEGIGRKDHLNTK